MANQNHVISMAKPSTRKTMKIIIGLSLVIISVTLGSLFLVKSYADVYWSHPAIFILFSIIGVCGALYGSFLIGNNLPLARIRNRVLSGLLTVLGSIVGLGGGLLGLAAIALAIAISGTGYWGSAPYEYSGDYLIMGWQILVLRLSILLGIVGGFLFGYGLRRKKLADNHGATSKD
jgi:hypothetical protein